MQAPDGQTHFHYTPKQFLYPTNVTWATAAAVVAIVIGGRPHLILSCSGVPKVYDLKNHVKPQFRREENNLGVLCFSGKPQMEFVQINTHTQTRPLTVVNHLLSEETISAQ